MTARSRKQRRNEPAAPWWAAGGPAVLAGRRWAGLLLLLTLAVGATRIAALPHSLWHQDEAEFAGAVLDFDIAWSRPHPPWFPLWIVTGKAVRALTGLSAARSLQAASAVLSTLSFIPLVLLWSLWLRRELAVAAALLCLLLPGVWMLSGRAFSDTPALALLLASLFLWLDPAITPRTALLGSVLAGLTVLVRPHHLILLAGPLAVAWRRGADRRALLVPFALLGAAGAAGLLIWGGPPSLLWKALRLFSAYQKSIVATATPTLAGLGLSRVLLHPVPAVLWAVLSVAGAVLLARSRRPGSGALLWATLLPAVAVLFLVFDPVEPRYWLPTLALSSGLVIVALAAALRRLALPAAGLAVLASAWAVVPALGPFRTETSPPLRGIARAELLARAGGRGIVADFNIAPFAEYLRLEGRLPIPMTYDVELGRDRGIPPPGSVVALYTDHQDRFVASGGTPVVFRARTPLLDRLVPGPYRITTVVPDATVRPVRRRDRGSGR